jgi:RNA polymerase sigma-70 factor (ECF subfamily)
LCGFTTEEIARAYLARPPTIAQRIVRAKQRLREKRIPYEIPESTELQNRCAQVMRVIYLVFNEGYSASTGTERIRVDLCAEAIRLARLLAELLPHPEADGLLALLILQDARRVARISPHGDIILFADQDRDLWDREAIAEGTRLAERALSMGGTGPYAIQAAIAAVYAESVNGEPIDWAQIVALHDALSRVDPSPVSRLARAIALSHRDGPTAGLKCIDELLSEGALNEYLPAHAAHAELCRQLKRNEEARISFQRALALALQEPEKRYLMKKLAELENEKYGTEAFHCRDG